MARISKKQHVVLICIALVSLSAVFAARIGKEKRSIEWQSSISPHVRLGVRDKLGELGEYKAEFIVTNPEGRQYKITRCVKGSDWGYVFFPDGFNAWWGQGNNYKWRCRVGNKVVAEGGFKHEYTRNGQKVTTTQ